MSMQVVLATIGSMERMIMSQWLRKKKVSTLETSEWRELIQILRELLDPISPVSSDGFDALYSSSEPLKAEMTIIKALINPVYIVLIDIALLDLSSDLWRERLNSLDIFREKAMFAWVVNHQTTSPIKTELSKEGQNIVVTKPLYKGKMIQILGTAVRGNNLGMKNRISNTTNEGM